MAVKITQSSPPPPPPTSAAMLYQESDIMMDGRTGEGILWDKKFTVKQTKRI